jgi:hypothetical protein
MGAAVAAEAGLLDFASSLFAADPKPAGKPLVRVVFLRSEVTPIVSWPGGNCDVPAQQALFTKTLQDAAAQLGVQLDVRSQPINKRSEIATLLETLKQSPPAGLIVCAMELELWELCNQIVRDKGNLPTVIYSHVSGFTSHLQCGRNTPYTYLGATQDAGWLAFALRMLHTIWRTKNTRILFVAGGDNRETTVAGVGTVFHWIPKARFAEEFKKVAATAEIRAAAALVAKNAQKIVEPSEDDILQAVKNYVVCRRLMEAENCQGIAIDCLGWHDPVCLAFSKLRDEGIVAACEFDANATIGMLLTHLLFQRPGFQQDPSPNTVNNTLIGAHCTSPLRLEGFDKPYQAPYLLRSYHTRTGVAPEVLWPVDKPVTILHAEVAMEKPVSAAKAEAKGAKIFVGQGRVVANIAQPPTGCCRTAVEIELDGVADTRDVKGFHQLFILGKHERMFRAYGQLAGMAVAPIAGNAGSLSATPS